MYLDALDSESNFCNLNILQVPAQEAKKAGLDLSETQYFEAHGTGTQDGDTIEAQGIATVFASRQEPLLNGSIKTNVGHTGAASGLASIIKTALAMVNGVISPSINFEKPNRNNL
ncbi:hypothetical protein N7507_009690 [Penicillium longicatenatum]|nr:hypothetical protein N7507_009690 [Penicillium longicatenatum]